MSKLLSKKTETNSAY